MRKIRKYLFAFIKGNLIISIIGILAVFLSLIFCISYKYFKASNIEVWITFFYNLSVSYIVALLFFIFQVYIPQLKSEKMAVESVKSDMSDLEKMLSITLECIRHYVSFDEEGCAEIKWDETEGQKRLYFIYKSEAPGEKQKSDKKGGALKRVSEQEMFYLNHSYQMKLNKIKESTCAKYFSVDMIRMIDDLERIKLFDDILVLLKCSSTFVKLSAIQNSLLSTQNVVDKLRETLGFDYKWIIKPMGSHERALIDNLSSISNYNSLLEFNVKTAEQEIKQKITQKYGEKSISDEDWAKVVEVIREQVSKQMDRK